VFCAGERRQLLVDRSLKAEAVASEKALDGGNGLLRVLAGAYGAYDLDRPGNVRAMAGHESFDQLRCLLGIEKALVGIDRKDVVARGAFKGEVSRRPEIIAPRKEMNMAGKGTSDLNRAVVRSRIDYHYLLNDFLQGPETRREVGFLVLDDECRATRCHDALSFGGSSGKTSEADYTFAFT
jgi:hypothetical protein